MQYVTLDDIRRAEPVIRRFFPPTPLLAAPRLSAELGAEVWLKLDTLTPVRTFKLRGALNKLHSLVDAGTRGGVVTASAGNHGLAVARAARLFGRPAVICVPAGANPQKVAAITAEGARVVHHGLDYQAAFEHAVTIAQAEGLTVVHAYDDPAVIAGQGTLGLEAAGAGPWDAVVMGIGGGGLISGVATAVKTLHPATRVIGVQPSGADSMVRSLAAGRITAVEQVRTMADGLGARFPGEWTFAHVRRWVDEVVTVEEEDFIPAISTLLALERVVTEPAGCAGVAALLRHGGARWGRRVLVPLTGANVSDAVLREALQAALR